jgi:hypothetical protein
MVRNAPIFIVGSGRSGTSLLRDMLCAHPDIAIPGESNFMPTFYGAYGDPAGPDEARRLAARILNLHWVKKWNLPLTPDDFAADRSFAAVVPRLYRCHATREGKARWGDKTPAYVSHIPLLAELFPGARFLHIVRDGRDVAMSFVRHYAGPRNVHTAAEHWLRSVEEGRRAGEVLGPAAYLEIRYESLVSDPETVLRGVCAFLDAQYHEAMANPPRRPSRNAPGVFASRTHHRVSSTRVVAENQGKWKDGLTRRQRVIFESVAQTGLRALGYEVEGDVRRISFAERLVWKGHQVLFTALGSLNTVQKSLWVPSHLMMRWASLRARLRRSRETVRR